MVDGSIACQTFVHGDLSFKQNCPISTFLSDYRIIEYFPSKDQM